MANRPDDFSPTVTNVVPQNVDTANLQSAALDIADQAATMSAHSKALLATSQTSLAFRQLDSQFRLAHSDDPTNPDALATLQAQRAEVVTNIGKGVPGMVMQDYTNKAVELGQASDTSNQLWTTKQQIRNTTANMQTQREIELTKANQSGQDFARSGGDIDLTTALSYAQANENIHQFADPIIGKDKTEAYLKDFNPDFVKSFVTGVASHNPQMAEKLLSDPRIADNFSSQDIGDMTNLIARTQKQNALAQSILTTKSDGQLTDIVNDPNSTYFEKRAKIDQMDMEGVITPKAAASARRVLTSSNDLDAQTDTPLMASIINKTYDLNAQAATKPADYLMGVRDIQQEVLDAQGNNQLTAKDAGKLNKQITDLTSAKLSAATQTAGSEFYQANKSFNTLPAEYRGQATRALFYAAHGQNMTPDQVKNQATQIIDQINQQRRATALTTVSRIANDDVFLQSANITRDQVAEAAKNKGITQDQVIQLLRNKYAAKPRNVPIVRRMAPADAADEAGSTKAPAPVINLPQDTDTEQ